MTDWGIRPLVFLCVIARKDNGDLGFSIIRIRIGLWGIYLVPTQIGLTGISFRWLRKVLKTFAGNRNYRIIKKQRKTCEGSEGEK